MEVVAEKYRRKKFDEIYIQKSRRERTVVASQFLHHSQIAHYVSCISRECENICCLFAMDAARIGFHFRVAVAPRVRCYILADFVTFTQPFNLFSMSAAIFCVIEIGVTDERQTRT